MADFLNPIAELDEADSGKIITPDEAYVIKKQHSFFCPDHDCLDINRVLIPSKSKLDNYFFKHKANCSHDIQPQTLLHKLAVKWFENIESFEIPSIRTKEFSLEKQIVKIDSTKTELEFRKLERIIPDVKLVTNTNFEFAVEIVVTSDISVDKQKLIEEFNLPTLRIDLSKFYSENQKLCRTDYNFVQESLDNLLKDIELKSWVLPMKLINIEGKLKYNKKTDNEKLNTNDNIGCLFILATFGLILLIKKYLK